VIASPCWFHGGLETVHTTLAEWLVARGWDVTLLVGRTDWPGSALELLPCPIVVDEALWEWGFPPTTKATRAVMKHGAGVLRELAPTVLISALGHGIHWAARAARVPVVLEYLHCAGSWDLLDHPADGIIGVSGWTLETVAAERPRMPGLRWVVHNGLPGRVLPGPGGRERVRRAHGWSREHRVVGFVGRLAPEKRIDEWMHAFADLRAQAGESVQGLVVGKLYDGAQLEIAQGVAVERGLGWGQDVQWVEALSGQMPDMYAAMDLLLHTRTEEPFGMVVIEAMGAGCPVAAYAGGGIPEIEPHCGGALVLAPVGDRAALVRLAALALEDGRLAGDHAAAIAGHFSADRMVDAVEAIMLELMGGETDAVLVHGADRVRAGSDNKAVAAR
jgi:glycosyltransferase involved in cell wall biosynthesis